MIDHLSAIGFSSDFESFASMSLLIVKCALHLSFHARSIGLPSTSREVGQDRCPCTWVGLVLEYVCPRLMVHLASPSLVDLRSRAKQDERKRHSFPDVSPLACQLRTTIDMASSARRRRFLAASHPESAGCAEGAQTTQTLRSHS